MTARSERHRRLTRLLLGCWALGASAGCATLPAGAPAVRVEAPAPGAGQPAGGPRTSDLFGRAAPAPRPEWTWLEEAPGAVRSAGGSQEGGAAAAPVPLGSRRSWLGAGAGMVVGGATTWIVLHQGGSTARCDQDANQDAWTRSQCWAASAAGGLVGAGIGALLAR